MEGGMDQSNDITEETEEWPGPEPGPPDHAQYSPSVSHDEEEEPEEGKEEGEDDGGSKGEESLSDEPWDDLDDKSDAEGTMHRSESRHMEDEAAPEAAGRSHQSSKKRDSIGDGSDTGGGKFGWDNTWEEEGGGGHREPASSRKAGWSIAGAKSRSDSGSSVSSVTKATATSTSSGGSLHSSPGLRPKKTTPNSRAGRKGPEIDRGRLSEEDTRRLEEQASWSMEPDFFADMAPVIAAPAAKTTPTAPQRSDGVEVSSPGAESGVGSSTALQYQPTEQENVSMSLCPESVACT